MAKILVVDDEKGMRYTLSEILRDEGHDVLAVGDALEALKILNDRDFEVIITDIIMPYFDGVDLLNAIHNAHANAKVILITGEPYIASGPRRLPDGAFDFLVKPFTRDQILESVTRALAEG